jgi:hypothetical protein
MTTESRRTRRPLSDIRARVVGVRLTDTEIETLEDAAARTGAPVSVWLRDLALDAARTGTAA